MSSVDQTNGYEEGVESVESVEAYAVDRPLVLELSLPEAQALKAWLLSSTSEGTPAIEDSGVKPILVKLGGVLDTAEAVASVRAELDRMGFESTHLNDEEILEFGRRVSQTSARV
jgi:hypothetical protein